jgi:hypothetical protein
MEASERSLTEAANDRATQRITAETVRIEAAASATVEQIRRENEDALKKTTAESAAKVEPPVPRFAKRQKPRLANDSPLRRRQRPTPKLRLHRKSLGPKRPRELVRPFGKRIFTQLLPRSTMRSCRWTQ